MGSSNEPFFGLFVKMEAALTYLAGYGKVLCEGLLSRFFR
jgi:hypothetical protein